MRARSVLGYLACLVCVVVLFLVFVKLNQVSSDNEMLAVFHQHEPEFERLVEQLQVDPFVGHITATLAYDPLQGVDIKGAELPYIDTMQLLKIIEIAEHSGGVIYLYSQQTWFNGDKGYAYLPATPGNVVGTLDSSDKWPQDGDMSVDTYFMRIKGNWYLFRTPVGD